MLFNSYEFLFLFFPLAVCLFFLTNRYFKATYGKVFLVLASLFFYAWWNPIYLPLILLSVVINFSLAKKMIHFPDNHDGRLHKKHWLIVSLILNLGLLGFFKYADFFLVNVNYIASTDFELFHFALPLAISFFTLQQIAFMMDSYEGLVEENNFIDYSLFVTFFPQLIAGPIVHHEEMMSQFKLKEERRVDFSNMMAGVTIFVLGLAKKTLIADKFSIIANQGYSNVADLSLLEGWATSLSYMFQLYFDFSGYTDMAIGAALFFNIKLPQNFNSPYKATGMIDFWKRWHMTLTNFITTYIYTPILFSMKNRNFHKSMLATILAFVIAGLWHGASWMFVIFGLLNGIGLVINHYWKKKIRKKYKLNINKYFAWFITFNFVNLTFIAFRSETPQVAVDILSSMLGRGKQYLSSNILSVSQDELLLVVTGFIITLLFKNTSEILKESRLKIWMTLLLVILFIKSVQTLGGVSEFLYFNF